jgi:Tfp pilus assembly protein PilO
MSKTPATRWQIDAYGAAATIALSIAFYVFGVSPLRVRHELVRSRSMELASKSAEAGELAGKMRSLAARVTSLQNQSIDHPLHLQSIGRLNHRLAEVTAAAGECGLDVNNIQPQQPLVGRRHSMVPIELSGTGSYRSCVEFMRQFHSRFVDSGIAGFALSRALGETGVPTTFRFRVIWYVEPENTAAAD